MCGSKASWGKGRGGSSKGIGGYLQLGSAITDDRGGNGRDTVQNRQREHSSPPEGILSSKLMEIQCDKRPDPAEPRVEAPGYNGERSARPPAKGISTCSFAVIVLAGTSPPRGNW